jgi:hypothetical protein
MALPFNALSIIFKIRLAPDERVHQLLLLSKELLNLLGKSGGIRLTADNAGTFG